MLAYLLRRRTHIRVFIALAGCAILCFLIAAGLLIAKTIMVNQRYAILVGIADSTSYDAKRESYIEAVKLCPQRTAAYKKLLETYEQNGCFDLEQSAEFTALYNSAKELWKEGGGGELAYLAGRMYLGLYTENREQVSMSAKVQKAASFFSSSIENSPEDEKLATVAAYYNTICEYYKNYILSSSDKSELTDAAVCDMFANASSALAAIQNCTEYDKLNLAGAICNLLYDQRSEFARVSPERGEEATALLQEAIMVAEETVVSRPELVEERDRIIANRDEYADAVAYAFFGTTNDRRKAHGSTKFSDCKKSE